MIANKHGESFFVKLEPSKKLQRLFIAIHLLALCASFANALPFVLKLVVAAFVGLNFKMTFHKVTNEKRTIKHSENLGWQLSNGGDFEPVEILTSTVITTVIIFLQIQDKPSIIIANDALSEDDYRRFIVKLKITVH
ncbi:MAG: protein YgfX [Methyloglobulus sp.]